MNKKNNQDSLSKFMSAAKVFFYLANLFIILFLVIGEIVSPSEMDEIHSNFREFEAQWEQVLENGERIPVEVPGKMEAEKGEWATVVTTVPTDIMEGQSIFFRPIWQDVRIYVDGELRVDYNTVDTRPFGTNSTFRYVFVELEKADAGKELTYQFRTDTKYVGSMRSCYIGDQMSVWIHLINESGVRTVIALFLFLMSLFCIIVCFILKWIYKKTLPLNYLAWTILLCALWVLSEIEFRQLLIKNVSVSTSLTYWTLMLIPLPLVTYIDVIQEGRYRKIYSISVLYAVAVTIAGTLLQVFDIVQFVEQLIFIHAGIVVSIICIIVTITVDVFVKRIRDYLAVGIGVYGLLVTAVLEMLLYYEGAKLSLGTVLLVGLLFLLIMAIIKTGQDLMIAERNKQQAILAREAQAKFLANMSHEIRTPINAVIGLNEMILRENNNEMIQEYARDIQSASNMLLGLVNDILDFSKIESGQLELVEDTYQLAPLLQDEMLLLNTRVAGKDISTHIEIDPYIPSAFCGDELRIKQIITNILSNAVKYTHEGSVTLKVFFKWIDGDNVELCFSVIDTGVGIKQNDLANLFDSFKRLELNKNRNIEGTGLGLNIVKQLVDLMHGTINVESVYGKGSAFHVSIPQKIMDKMPLGNIAEALKGRGLEKKNVVTRFVAPKANILAVDDNSMNLSVVKGLLKRTEIQLDLATGGLECLELTKHKKYHIILMDHMMPELDGIETLHRLRADNSNPNQNTVVIALTANAIAGCRDEYLSYGFNDYISKPIHSEKLEELLLLFLPAALVQKVEKQDKSRALMEMQGDQKKNGKEDLLFIDRDLGLSYSLDMEDVYKDVLEAFCEQGREYLPMLEEYFTNRNWEQYAIVAHGLKGNTLNVGASVFSQLSLQHELAAKEKNESFLLAEYATYVTALKQLIEKVEGML